MPRRDHCCTTFILKPKSSPMHLHRLSSNLGASPDLLLSNVGFPHLEQGDLVQIFIPSAPTRRLTLEVNYPEKKGDRGTTNLQVRVQGC
jgi:hypothetical protein